MSAARSDADRNRLERDVKAADRKTDAPVYWLYGLTGEEIRVVEGPILEINGFLFPISLVRTYPKPFCAVAKK